jgi:hypothetical protein
MVEFLWHSTIVKALWADHGDGCTVLRGAAKKTKMEENESKIEKRKVTVSSPLRSVSVQTGGLGW